MSKTSWIVGARVHHLKNGFGTIVGIEQETFTLLNGSIYTRIDGWKVRKDKIKSEKHRFNNPSREDRQGWHIINSKSPQCRCEDCRKGLTVDPQVKQ